MMHLKNKKYQMHEGGRSDPPPDRSGRPPDRNGRRELSREGLRKAPEWGREAGIRPGKLLPQRDRGKTALAPF
jgi:hypothetical protein